MRCLCHLVVTAIVTATLVVGRMKALTRTIFTPTNPNHILLDRLRANDDALVRIIFTSRDLGLRGVHMLATALRTNTNLKALDISSNDIGPSGAHFVALILLHQSARYISNPESTMFHSKKNDIMGGVRTLILSDNNLRDAGVQAMAQALENSIVECLWIDGNQISDIGLVALTDALQGNLHLRRLHIHHNLFQSFSPLITCMLNKQSLDTIANSNHALKHVFLNCGYTVEWKELESILTINRMGIVDARRKKIAMYIEEKLEELLPLDMISLDARLIPRMLSILTLTYNISATYDVIHELPSEAFVYHKIHDKMQDINDNLMNVEYS